MTTTQPTNRDEINAVNLADGYAEAALDEIREGGNKSGIAGVYALLYVGAQFAALRETLNRELPDIAGAITDAERTARLAGQG